MTFLYISAPFLNLHICSANFQKFLISFHSLHFLSHLIHFSKWKGKNICRGKKLTAFFKCFPTSKKWLLFYFYFGQICVQFNVPVSASKSGKTGKVSPEMFGLLAKEENQTATWNTTQNWEQDSSVKHMFGEEKCFSSL